ncbi:MAG: hypothetical protein Q7R52_05010 [archaeon]|nr:hypothetical protein [archaeon]
MDRKMKEVGRTIIVAFAIILFWRGLWGLMDVFLFPENQMLSYILSIFIGMAILYETETLTGKLI